MDVISFLVNKDTNLFLFLNNFHFPFFDNFMFLFSEKLTWLPLYIATLYVFVRQWKKESLWIILTLVLCIVLADQISSGILKEFVQRPRPSHEPVLDGLVHIVGYRGGRYGFVSSHAANSFAFALFTSLFFRRKLYTWIIFLWAAVNCYSRIYLGVHYPLDIAGGILAGLFPTAVLYYLLLFFRQPIAVALQRRTKILHKKQILIPVAVLLLSVTGIAVYSCFVL
jgi:undecaprenyl-diphosphatase